ncbi:MAG TPA: hypothetical protein QF753_15865 [Victivallales bacterium]|nr:hypothetical protein [Victivallales bacterium]
MKKKVVLFSSILTMAFFLFQANLFSATANSTPFKFCFWPGAGIPLTEKVDGGCIGIVTYGNVDGIDLGIISLTKKVSGGKVAIITNGEKARGIELGIANFQNHMSGFQAGIYNRSTNLRSGAQLGIVNRSNRGNGMQFGIVNIMENGFVRVFPFINFPKDWFH